MNDPKAAAAYHPGDAPVTRPDLDAIRSRAAESKAAHDDYMTVSPGDRRRADRDSARDVPVLLAALAAERARADQAEQRIADAPHGATCEVMRAFRPSAPCECWKSDAPTAEQ